jgi:acyl-CoA synthetase (AMP-forming)/AMP-acid ligase II
MELIDADRFGDRVALVDAVTGQTTSYRALDASAREFASVLDSARKELVFLFAASEPAFVRAYLGALLRGHAVVLLDPALDRERREALVRTYRPRFIVGDTSRDGVLVTKDAAAVHPDLALLLSTSGTIGSPKLVRLRLSSVIANAASIAASLAIVPDDRAPTSLPLAYSYGLSVLNSHLHAGASVLLEPNGVVTREFWTSFRAHECTSFAGVPFSYEALARLRMERTLPPSLRTMTQAGGRLSSTTAERFHAAISARGGRFFTMYGQTEATARMSCLPSERFAEKKGSVGRAIDKGSFRIDAGEVVYEGPNVMMGYASTEGDLALGDELSGVLRTGDLGTLDADGFLTLIGRLKRIAKVYGHRFNLDEIEAFAAASAEAPVAVIARDDLVIVFAEIGAGDAAARLRSAVADHLRVHPDAVDARSVTRIPTNPNGKPDYRAIESWA